MNIENARPVTFTEASLTGGRYALQVETTDDDGKVYTAKVAVETKPNRNGFRHVTDYNILEIKDPTGNLENSVRGKKATVKWINRTWEMYDYQILLGDALENFKKKTKDPATIDAINVMVAYINKNLPTWKWLW